MRTLIGLIVFYILLLVPIAIGWVMNVIVLFNMSWDVVTGEFILRLVGIPIPVIGAVMGWL